MKDRSFAELLVGALCISLLGALTLMATTPPTAAPAPTQRDEARWELPKRRRRKRTIEDACRHCTGSGTCAQCTPEPCRVCQGNGVQPRDPALIARLDALWGVA